MYQWIYLKWCKIVVLYVLLLSYILPHIPNLLHAVHYTDNYFAFYCSHVPTIAVHNSWNSLTLVSIWVSQSQSALAGLVSVQPLIPQGPLTLIPIMIFNMTIVFLRQRAEGSLLGYIHSTLLCKIYSKSLMRQCLKHGLVKSWRWGG